MSEGIISFYLFQVSTIVSVPNQRDLLVNDDIISQMVAKVTSDVLVIPTEGRYSTLKQWGAGDARRVELGRRSQATLWASCVFPVPGFASK
jgi:hypothetical protein